MLFMWFALVLQVSVLLELCLNRIIGIVLNTKRSSVRRMADANFVSQTVNLIFSILLLPITWVGVCVQVLLGQVFFCLSLLVVIGVFAVINQSSSNLLTLLVNVYNSGIGEIMNTLVIAFLELFAPLFRVLLPIWNSIVYMAIVLIRNVFLPFVFVNSSVIPDLLLNLTTMVSTLAISLADYVTALLQCVQYIPAVENATSPFWVNDLACVATPYTLTLDLMTPAVFAVRTVTNFRTMFISSCGPATNVLTVLFYPLIDYNFYKMVHGAVNFVLHVVLTLPVWTANRCAYAENTVERDYTALEKKIMCIPDVSHAFSMLTGTMRAFGALVDNCLDISFAVVYSAVSGQEVDECSDMSLQTIWQDASEVFGTRKLQVVGMTRSLYAITDGDSVMYHSMSGSNTRSSYALHTWPFHINTDFGVAAVRYGEANDFDDEGGDRTGLLGCQCQDTADGVMIVCASVPYQKHLAEDDAENAAFTTHRVRFLPDSARAGLMCSNIVVRVSSLRFSRKRFSSAASGERAERSFVDPYKLTQANGDRQATSRTADAAIIVMPLCAVRDSATCLPTLSNCFPFCMALHAAGQSTQTLTMHNAQSFTDWTSIGQTDCVVREASSALCSDQQRMAVNAENDIAMAGCGTTQCALDADTVTFMQNDALGTDNRSISSWNSRQSLTYVRSERQPFVFVGDMFLYSEERDPQERSGVIRSVRLFDNKRGDFSMQQEELSLVASDLQLQYAECASDACYRYQLEQNKIVLPLQVTSQPVYMSAVSEWAVHWVSTPDLGNCAVLFEVCAGRSADGFSVEDESARLWSVYTVRSTNDLGEVFTESRATSYMVIPQFFKCSQTDQCNRVVNMKVTGLEYMDEENLLLTVLATSAENWDWRTNDVMEGGGFEYRYYFVHPNRHDCTTAGSSDAIYTCWREETAGMFRSTELSLSATGSLCPAMQRMPKWGSMLSEVGIATASLLEVFVETVFTLPASLTVQGGLGEVFQVRASPTFHRFLDMRGASLLDLDPCFRAIEQAAFHMANTLTRAAKIFEGRPGGEVIEPILLGTARVFQYTSGLSMVENRVLGPLASSIPFDKFINMMSKNTQSAPATPFASGATPSSNYLQMFTSMFSGATSWSKVMCKAAKKMGIKVLMKQASKKGASGIMTVAYELNGDMRRNVLDSMRYVCDGFGQVIGRTNAWGQLARHSCMLGPDSVEGVMTVLFILTLEYPVMDCVCKQAAGLQTEEAAEKMCMPQEMSIKQKSFVMQVARDASEQQPSQCFSVMDATNDRLLKAMDPVLSRMYKAATAIQNAFASILSGAGSTSCSDWEASPFVLSLLPEPVDYFMGCMHTIDCRSRCLDNILAFEEALSDYRRSGAQDLSLSKPFEIDTESRFFNVNEEFEGKHLAPFVIYAVMPMQDSVCDAMCSGSSRCVSIAGMDASVAGHPQGQLETAYYCVPVSVLESVYRADTGVNTSEYGSFGAGLVTSMHIATRNKVARSEGEWLVVVTRSIDTGLATVWMLPGSSDVSFRVLQTQSFLVDSYSDTGDVNDRRWSAQRVNDVFVLPAHSNRSWCTVFVSLSQTTPSGFVDDVCVYTFMDTAAEGVLYDNLLHPCSAEHAVIFPPKHHLICLDADCKRAVRLPHSQAQLELVEFDGYQAAEAEAPAVFDWKFRILNTSQVSSQERSAVGAYSAEMLTLTQSNKVQLMRRQLSSVGYVTKDTSAEVYVDVAMTGRGQAMETWLQNVRIVLLKDDAVRVAVSTSFATLHKVQMVVNCSVSTCVGCQGTGPREADIQHKCFAAASCAIGRCVGSTVNMNRPMCQIGALIATLADNYRILLVAFWTFFANNVIFVVELSANRRQQYEIAWPAEIKQMYTCRMKDSIIQFWALFGAMIVNVATAFSRSKSKAGLAQSYTDTTMQLSSEARTQAMTTVSTTAFVELMVHVSMGVVYVPIVAWKMMQCKLDSAFGVLSGSSGPVFKLGSVEFDKADEAAVGVCLGEKVKQALADVSDANTNAALKSDVSNLISNLSGMMTGQIIGNFAFVYDAFFAWAGGVCNGVMNVVQVLDWTRCKLPSIDNAVVSSCVCGDKSARIPDAQRQAKHTTDSLWCYGLLMLSDVEGNDQLVWNPYSLHELLQLRSGTENLQQYLDCISMNRCNFESLIPAAVGSIADYVACINSNALYEPSCAKFDAYTLCVKQDVDCNILKPTDAVFEAQGVEILQVITRCRNNYQQKRWDQAAPLLGMIDVNAWTADPASEAKRMAFDSQSDSLSTERKRFSMLAQFMRPFSTLDEGTWSCLNTSLADSQWSNNCAELGLANLIFPNADSLLKYFEYEIKAEASSFENMDACESFSGRVTDRNQDNVLYPKIVWDGDSANAVPVAELHYTKMYDQALRMSIAERELDNLITHDIKPLFRMLTMQALEEIATTYWSFDGDFVHQLVDCIILGPFAAADMMPAFRTATAREFPVPQYHRGSADSRKISFANRTSGSDIRRQIMAKVIAHIGVVQDDIVMQHVTAAVSELHEAYSVKANLYCRCFDGSKSLECCLVSHDDLSTFMHTFTAQYVLHKVEDLKEEIQASLASSIFSSTILTEDIWANESFAYTHDFHETDRAALGEAYFFDYSKPVYHYAASEVALRMQDTVWTQCTRALRAAFSTLPLLTRGDDVLEVDAETMFDPNEFVHGGGERYLHSTEQTIERILAKARTHSPVFWSHVHRYMPSDSVWCEDTAAHAAAEPKTARVPAEWHDMVFTQESIHAPDAAEVLYVAHVTKACPCAWKNGSMCIIPPAVCDSVYASHDENRWNAMCSSGAYNSSSDIMFVRSVLENAGVSLPSCREYHPSTVWGLLDSTQQYNWYNGRRQQWNVSLQEIATFGPGGVRLADLLESSPRDFDAEMSLRIERHKDHGIWNTQFEHTIAQPVCNGTYKDYLRRNLSEYFMDVLFPMAHSVHEAPSQAICGRWVTEYALYALLSNVSGPTHPDVEVQRLSEELWRRRCLLQLEQIGICNLRNVFHIAPVTHKSYSHCPFSVIAQHGCDPFYVTEACLVMCGGVFYDPCMCTDAQDCNFSFSPASCATGVILMPPSTSFDMASLHWPRLAWPDTETQGLLDRVQADQSVHGIPFVLDDEMIEYVLAQANKDEGGTPDAFCDDTLDYLHPEARHPVGYHPTCACTRARTNMRGFTSWMSSGDEYAWSIDASRVRNMSQFSSAFGSSHLVCDAAVYGVGYEMNNLQMHSKWNPNARADPAVPIAADYVSVDSMSQAGSMSGDAWDTPHVPAPQADTIFTHSVGIVRDWLRYHSDEDGAAEIQTALDDIWPHWHESIDTYGAKPDTLMEAGCTFPPLFTCVRDSDCGAESLTCKYYDVDDDPLGICVHPDTCFRHDHCAGGKLCSGQGVCVPPELVMRNTLDVEIDAHVFAKKSTQCSRSSFGMSKEQRVPSFARDNGLCGVRNYFTYKNVTEDVRSSTEATVLDIPDKRIMRTAQREDNLLTDETYGFLRMQTSACDRNYEHTDYGICTPCAVGVVCTASTACMCTDSNSQPVHGMNTWEKNAAGGIDVRFCDVTSSDGDLVNLVSPYVHIDGSEMMPEDTLQESRTDIKRCLDFDICPTSSFTIRGQNVAQRVVLVQDTIRTFALEDTRLCFAFGLWDDDTEMCSLDRLVVPMFDVIYTDGITSASLVEWFKSLRDNCENAFGTDYDSAMNDFESVYNELRSSYAPSSSADIQTTVNTLLLKVFNIQPASLLNRGIDNMQQYTGKAKCVRYVYERLQAVRISNTVQMEAHAVQEEETPGSTLYLFHPHAPLEVPLLWFWKCVIIARDTAEEGGAPLQWLKMMTADLDATVPCVNADSNSTQNSTLLRHLQLQADIYVSSVKARTNIDIFSDMLLALEMSFAFWNIDPLPSIHCFVTPTDQHEEWCGTSQYNKSCQRVFAPPTSLVPQKEDVLNSMYDLALQFLFKRSRSELESMNALTLQTLLGWNLAEERALESDLAESTDYSNAIPVYELTALAQDLTDLVGTEDAHVFRLQNTRAVNCESGEPLQFAEYQIASSLCASTTSGEIPEPNDKLRVQMYNRVHALIHHKTMDPEVLECFHTNDIKYDAISQKHALLLLLHYLKYVIHSTKDSKFGMLTYDQDVRWYMQRDMALVRGVAQVAAKASRYEMHIVSKHFICSETEMFPDPVPVSPLQTTLRNCLADLKRDIGWKVPKLGTLVLEPAGDVFLGGFYTSFAVSSSEVPFIDKLVGTDWQNEDYVYGRNELCFKTSTGASYLRPLWTGDLDLQSCPFGAACGCETSRDGALSFFDVSCDGSSSMESCKTEFPSFYSAVTTGMYEDCYQQQNKPVTLTQYEQMKDGNLCLLTPSDGSVCSRDFGAHGRVRGRAAGDLHVREDVQEVQSGLFDAGSAIFQSLTSVAENVTAVRLLGSDIGGHSIGFSVHTLGRRNSGSQQIVLDLTCVSAGRSCQDQQMRRWLSQARETWRLQHLRFLARSIPRAQAAPHWVCPLQWLSMYGDNRTLYAARSPNANRNRARFEHITGDSYFAHATVSSALKVAQHPARFMSDASACVDAVLQGSAIAYACKGRALLYAATQMHRKGWSRVALHTSSASCTRVLDWPHRAFKTADGFDGGDTEEAAEYCNVFDRLPSFAVRYVTVELDAIQKRMRLPSTAAGGVCHMGRLKRLPKNSTSDSVQFCTAFPAHSRCRMLAVATQPDATLLVSTYETDIPVQDPYVARKAVTRPVRHCKLCEDHARASFVDRFQRERALDNGPVQLSVGLPVRLATERVLAAEIRKRLCPDSRHACDKMDALVRQKPHIWQKGSLMQELMRTAQEHHHAAAPVVRDEELWAQPWVFCRNQPDRCAGVIDKNTWQDPSTRFGACSAAVGTHSQEDSTRTRFCTLSPQLANLCVKLERWSVEDVPFILCKAAGHPDCLTQSFFYNPTAFSISNKDFVYNSVRAMYTKLDAAACPSIAANRQVLQNEVMRSQCGSVALEPVRNILSLARSFGFDFSILSYCVVSFGMNMVGVILGAFANMQSLLSESVHNMKVYATLFLNKLNAVMGVLWKVLFQLADYDAFKWIKEIIKMYCWVLENVLSPVIKKALLPFWTIILTVFKEMKKGLAFLKLGAIFDPTIAILTFAVDAATNFPDSCPEDGGDDDEFRAPGTLPVATKCWSTYNTFFGDNNVLSCTKADTCHVGVTDTSLVMCGSCAEPSTDFAVFGCLSVTKTCTCSVPVSTMQYCESNSDCYADESSCKYLDNELEPSIGFTRCSSCQHKRLCFVGVGSSVGYCACTLFDVQWGRCLDQGAAVNPGYENMCVLTTDYNALQSTFVFSFDVSLSTPCRLLNQGFTFCSKEGGNGFLYVTGSEAGRRRHLLEFTPNDNGVSAIDTLSSLCRDALSTDSMANVRRDCLDAFEDSKVTVRMLGMEDAWPACAFCGAEDIMHNFVFKPHNMIILFSNASSVARVFMRHTYVSHVMAACKAWRSMASVVAHELQGTQGINDSHVILLRVLNFSLVYALDPNASDTVELYAPQRRLLATQDRLAEAITRANVMHRKFIQEASVYFSFTFETAGQQSEWMSTWPPQVSAHVLSDGTCTPAVNVIKAMGWTFGNLTASYAVDARQEVSLSINSAWVVLTGGMDTGIPWDAVADKYDVVTRASLWLVDYLLGLVGLHRRDIYDVLAAAISEFPHVLRCDIKAVQTCYKWKKHALHVMVILAVYFLAVYVFSVALGLGAPALLLLAFFPFAVTYMTYGVSPVCSPMVPVCIYDDFLWTARLLLPVHVELPLVMYKNMSCLPVRDEPIQADCLRTCDDDVFGYNQWYTVFAWWSVEFNVHELLLRVVGGMPRVLVSEDDYDALTAQVALKARAMLDADQGLLIVNRVCAFVGLYMALPYLFICTLLIFIASSLLQTAVLLACSLLNILVNLLLSGIF